MMMSPFDRGYAAAQNAEMTDANPYEEGTDASLEWEDGWWAYYYDEEEESLADEGDI